MLHAPRPHILYHLCWFSMLTLFQGAASCLSLSHFCVFGLVSASLMKKVYLFICPSLPNYTFLPVHALLASIPHTLGCKSHLFCSQPLIMYICSICSSASILIVFQVSSTNVPARMSIAVLYVHMLMFIQPISCSFFQSECYGISIPLCIYLIQMCVIWANCIVDAQDFVL